MVWKILNKATVLLLTVVLLVGCSVSYKFTSTSIDYTRIKTIEIADFPLRSAYVWAPMHSMFNNELADAYATQTKLDVASKNKSIIDKALKNHFSPEFLNRLDEQILFNPLTKEDIEKIIDIELKGLYSRVEQIGFKLKITPAAKKYVAEEGYDPQYGARPLKRAIQKLIEDPVSEAIISKKINPGETIELTYSDGQISVKQK